MRILILANNDVGLYKFRKELIEKLLADGNEVYISLPDGELVQPLQDMGCIFLKTDIDRRGLNPVKDLKLVNEYQKIVKTYKPDMVITYTIKPNIYGGFVSKMKNIPYAVNITGLGTAFQNEGLLKKMVTTMYKTALKKAKVVYFENIENQNIFLDNKIIKSSQAHLLNGAGVNLDHYTYTEYPSSNKEVRFLFVGRVMKEKGIDELFDALKRLIKENHACILDVVGGYEENYSEVIKRYENEGWLKYHGYQKDVRPFIANAHCFVLPSYHEGMANTNLESAAMGRPLITSNIHGCKEAVVENQSGYLCEPKNSESLYETMKSFLLLSHDEKVQMGRMGRKHMEDVFDKNKVVEDTLTILCKRVNV